jgi:hypothetical protein
MQMLIPKQLLGIENPLLQPVVNDVSQSSAEDAARRTYCSESNSRRGFSQRQAVRLEREQIRRRAAGRDGGRHPRVV